MKSTRHIQQTRSDLDSLRCEASSNVFQKFFASFVIDLALVQYLRVSTQYQIRSTVVYELYKTQAKFITQNYQITRSTAVLLTN